jgi:hypothetical protein
LESGGSSFSGSRTRAGSKTGLVPEVRKRPPRAVKKKRMKMARPVKASLFLLRSRQDSSSLELFGAAGASIDGLLFGNIDNEKLKVIQNAKIILMGIATPAILPAGKLYPTVA